MTDNHARKRAARKFQRENPGTSFMRAYRHATEGRRRPLTAVLGRARNGDTVSVNLDWRQHDGNGPHCLIVGTADSQPATLLAVLGNGLAANQHPGDLELFACGDAIDLRAKHRQLNAEELTKHVDEILTERMHQLRQLNCRDIAEAREQGHRLSTVVVLIDDTHEDSWTQNPRFAYWTQTARSMGINIALSTRVEAPASHFVNADVSAAEALMQELWSMQDSAVLIKMTSTIIYALSDKRGLVRTTGSWLADEGRRAEVMTDFVFDISNGTTEN